MNDPELMAEGKKAKIDFSFISAEQVQKDFNALMNQTPEILKEMGKYIKARKLIAILHFRFIIYRISLDPSNGIAKFGNLFD